MITEQKYGTLITELSAAYRHTNPHAELFKFERRVPQHAN